MTSRVRALVMAKAPVPGLVKTRLGHAVGMVAAARLAAAALLDTLDACTSWLGPEHCHLALDGDLTEAVDGDLIRRALTGWSVTEQRGDSFAARLVAAHGDLSAAGRGPVVQIGMDTPQVTPQHLAAVEQVLGARTGSSVDAVLGPAPDGGWWVLALRDSAGAAPLRDVAMSTPSTFADTWEALSSAGLVVATAPTLRDVDTVTDAVAVAAEAPANRFARTWAAGAWPV